MNRIRVAALLITMLVVGGFANADEAPTDADGAQISRALDAEMPDGGELSCDEQLGLCAKRIERMRTVLSITVELAETVRQEDGDLRRLNCINEKLAAIKGFLKVSEKSYTELRVAAGSGDRLACNHHFGLITVSGDKVRELGEEAQTCVGDVQVFTDETVVDRREDPGLADVDPIVPDDDRYGGFEDNIFDDGFATETLPELTPFQ